MNEKEMKKILAYVFQAKGVDEMDRKKFVMDLSMKRKWMMYSEAVALVENMTEAGLLDEKEGTLILKFDKETVKVSSDFRPGRFEKSVSEKKSQERDDQGKDEEEGGEAMDKEDAIIGDWSISKDIILDSKAKWKETLGVGEGGALILAGYENGADVSELINFAREKDSLNQC